MRGVRSEDLLALVDFLYFGEANVCQDDLESFLAIAEVLQLKGLMGSVTSDGVRDAVKNVLADFARQGGRGGTPLTDNHFAKKPLAERGGTPPPP